MIFRKVLSILFLSMATMVAMAQASAKTYYVKADGSADKDGSSWDEATTLTKALEKAVAGDQIFVLGYDQSHAKEKEYRYYVPTANKKTGFQLKAGVKMYGGFKDNETKDERDKRIKKGIRYKHTYQSCLVADGDVEDVISNDLLIFSENETRSDNAYHVLTMDLTGGGSTSTVLDGFVLAAGNAAGSKGEAEGHGGGVFVTSSSTNTTSTYEISQCFFVNNYGSMGGAIYVDKNVQARKSVGGTDSYIQYCGIYNNASGGRSSNNNLGGGIYLSGAGVVHNSVIYNNMNGGVLISNMGKVVNCSIVHNSSSATDLEDESQAGKTDTDGGTFYNTVIWGNSTLCKTKENHPTYRYCAFPEVAVTDKAKGTDANGNKYISTQNITRSEAAAWLSSPTTYIGYDRSFNSLISTTPTYSMEPEVQSALLGSGSMNLYTSNVGSGTAQNTDLANNTRYQSTTIDIGAYELARLSENRRRYVKEGGTGNGTSWDDAMGDVQKAIDELAKNDQKGEVWIAKGVYTPSKITSDGNTLPISSFVMRDGISVYGGFAGKDGETIASRERNSDNFWEFANETKLVGSGAAPKKDDVYQIAEPNWNSTNNEWNVTSTSSHVVWFAPLAGSSTDFTNSTILDGVTIMGGSSQQNLDDGAYRPYSRQGAGVYMASSNAILRNCIVTNNNAGKSKSVEADAPSQGGGVYCKYGQVRYSLIYNNSAESGGGVYLEDAGFINKSMLTNNSANKGAGAYLKKATESLPDYLILASSIVSNNTSTENGAVYVDGAGLVEQNTIVNNYTSNVTDAALSSTSRTAGLYITKKAVVINNLLWNNSLYRKNSNATSSSLAQTYADTEASKDNVLFYNNAISDVNAVAWNRIYQSGTVELASTYQGNIFSLGNANQKQYLTPSSMEETLGVQPNWKSGITYFWKPVVGAIVRNRGLLYGQLPTDVWFKPSTDFLERDFANNPPIGAYNIDAPQIVFEKRSSGTSTIYRLYHNPNNYDADSDGSSWNRELFSINEALSYIASLSTGQTIKVLSAKGEVDETIPSTSTVKFEICCREGKMMPTQPYTFQEYEPKSKSVQVPASTFPITIMGGYPAKETNPEPTDEERDSKKYRTEFTGNTGDSDLSDGLFHIFRIETGANVTLDGIAITNGYAAGTAFIPYGGGVLIGSTSAVNAVTNVTLHNCILENNTAAYGAAIAVMPGTDVRNVNLVLENCVVNNNTSDHDQSFSVGITSRATTENRWAENVIEMNDESNKLSLYHVTIVNNIGKAPEASIIGKSSFAAGNEVYKSERSRVLATENAHNTQTINTLGKKGAANFSNPTKAVGAKISGNVYYGGNAEFRPLTGSIENDAIINRGVEDATHSQDKDIVGNDRNLGGAPDLGAYEAILPKAGKVIYVRSYNTDYQADDCIDGTPDFNLLNENQNAVYDGTTWSRAIMGNAVCDVTQERNDNDFYVTESNGKLIAATLDESKYADGGKYGPTSGAYSDFFPAGTSGKDNGNKNNVTANSTNRPNSTIGTGRFNQITNDRYERYISGLQYAVEQAAKYNKANPDKEPMVVWVGAGVYTDYKGFVIRDGVKVYGGFCKDGNPSETDRRPLLSQYVPARKQYQDLKKSDYETILQIRKETPVYMTNSSKELWYSEGKPTDGSKYDYAKKLIDGGTVTRHYVLYQPDVCLPTWGVSGDDKGTATVANQYRYPGFGSNEDQKYYHEYKNVTWDGFSIRHGYITNYEANRDGGSGVRVFRGIRLENLIIVNNLTHGVRSRGGGLYMDGDNSVISNSYLLQNLVWGNKDCYGGGAYMIQGVGYNMVVASNRSLSPGGGIFIESAKFYNNTVAYNMANNVQGTGIMHWQDNSTGISSQLTLYNCLVYDNMRNEGVTDGTTQIGSSSSDKFQTSYNNYVNSDMGALANKFKKENGNVTGDSIAFPFAVGGYGEDGKKNTKDIRWRTARLQNDFRLNEPTDLAANPCLNGGTEAMPNIPATDMDYTDRIKDCTIDIGAYEADNTANIKPQEKVNLENTTKHEGITDYVYYVTQNGAGNRSGDSPENAACASKLQSVLTAAGVKAETVNQNITENDKKSKVYVKVAGYKTDDDGNRFVYHANTLADPEDPQSYTFLIPNGVWLMGGYYEGGEYGEDGKEIPANWDDDKRDIMTNYRTVLSAKTEPKLGSAVEQEVNGYHAVTFGKWPSEETMKEYNSTAIPYRATLDGVTLTDGLATDDGFKGMGGAAIIPENAHIRNCIISGCEANKGGGIYLLPGGMLTGSILKENTAKEGGAVYAAVYDPTEGSVDFHAYLMSCTIAGNTATIGGGISQELGAIMVGNTVIWGNKASTDNNVSGVVDQPFEDQAMNSLTQDKKTLFYPYNNCYVEKYVLPANTWNREMESDMDTYFTSNGEYYPRPYSVLVEGGVSVEYYQAWANLAGVLLYDILGVDRNSKAGGQVTAGAYAMTLPFKDTNSLLKRIFVSNNGGAEVSAEVKQKYLGRSFYTPFNTLDAALAYINKMRETKIQVTVGSGTSTTTVEKPLATDTTKFEILMTGGVYKPTTMRENEDVTTGQTVDRRLNSFVIPVNVNIFGSFAATDPYSSNPITLNDKGEYINVKDDEGNEDNFKRLTDENNQEIELKPNVDIKTILNYRNTDEGHMVDQNLNGLIEPWEFANPTVLDGDIKESATEKKVYHVVFSKIRDTHQSSAANDNDVMLDGITIQNGETRDKIRWLDEAGTEDVTSEIGHGAGIYSYDVSYTLNRCRVMNNVGVHGGGIYVKDGSLDIINSFVGGNTAGSESGSTESDAGKGGGVFVYISDNASDTDTNRGNFHAVNSIFVNNSAKGLDNFSSDGGAIYVRRAKNTDINYHDMFIMNCIIAKNAAQYNPAVSCGDMSNTVGSKQEFPIALYNSVLWNNEGGRGIDRSNMWHCASDNLSGTATQARTTDGNIALDKENGTATGPRFKSPTTTAGSDGFNYMAKWNPFSVSILTDAGDGMKDATGTETGKYLEWWNLHVKRLPAFGYDDDDSNYIRIASEAQERAAGKYSRFMGAMNEDGTITNKPIDIGFYEFQYNNFGMSDHEALYVGTTDEGLADGSSWDNQTSDLRGAIIAMANPTGNKENLKTDRKVYVRNGEYYSPTLTSGDAYRLTVNNTTETGKLVTSVEIMGACTGNLNNVHEQDFSHQTVLVPNEKEENATNSLLNISTNGRPVTISGFTFQNTCNKDGVDVGVGANINDDSDAKGRVVFKNCGFRNNHDNGLNVGSLVGGVLIYNTLFADGDKNGISTKGKLDVLNATFVKNKGADIVNNSSNDDNIRIANSVSWKNGTTILTMNTTDEKDANNNKLFASDIDNEDVMKGPNFADPNNGDYRIRPSYMLLNKGSNNKYIEYLKTVNSSFNETSLKAEKDLGNLARLTGESVDIGAYECDTKLQPIIYVSTNGNGSGESWASSTNDLQGAINLAELYANTNNASPYGYVFVEAGVTTKDVNITLPGVKVYGTMNGNETASGEKDLTKKEDIEATVSEVLGKRKGVLEQGSFSAINGMTMNFSNNTTSQTTNVIDGFMLRDTIQLNNGYISTSILDSEAILKSSTSGNGGISTLYNSLALGAVTGNIKSVNVTAIGDLPTIDGNGFNRTKVTTTNPYVTAGYWKYQLAETDKDLDPANNTNAALTEACIAIVGHQVDLAGNKRIRNQVDNGCFETWHITETYTADAKDYPHGKSVIYVDEDKELKLDKTFYTEVNNFSPGFILLKYHAGLRGGGSYISLDNLAVERKLKKGEYDMCVMPFSITQAEVRDIESNDNTTGEGYTAYSYNGSERAKYNYKYDSTNGSAWRVGQLASHSTTDGMTLAATRNQTVRYYGTSYTETKALVVRLRQSNYAEDWDETHPSSTKFVAKENMGWNLFGSPYLCAMNYADMEYSRVIYVWKNGNYSMPINTEQQATGYIPAFDAAFTQTATLSSEEQFYVTQSTNLNGGAYETSESQNLSVMLTAQTDASMTRSTNPSSEGDKLQMNIVSPAEANNNFGMAADGVKLMSTNAPQLYAIRNGGRYSLLSAVSEAGSVNVGVSLPTSGVYSFTVPEDCDASKYEAVTLKDAQTGKAVDLLQGEYEFMAPQAGEINNRFTISFNRMEDDLQDQNIKVWIAGSKTLMVSGIQEGDLIHVYTASGQLDTTVEAVSSLAKVYLNNGGLMLVEIMRDGKKVAVKKLTVK